MKTLYGPIEPYQHGMLKVSEIHDIYYEQCGNPDGQPVVFLHGGPGAGLTADYRRFFDPKAYRIVLFDQRGAGRSSPHASLEENTTWRLVSDIERLRQHLGVEKRHALKLRPDQNLIDEFSEPHKALSLARIEAHYFMNNAFFETDNYLLENVGKIRHIPAVIVQGGTTWSAR
jgi:hypothetical protein